MTEVVNINELRPFQPLPALPAPDAPAETVVKLEPVDLPVDKLRAVLLCVGKDEARYYLNGIFVHRTDDGFVRAVATDGHRLMVANLYREYADQPGPAWLTKGVIIPADGLAARLSLISKTHAKTEIPLTVAYADESAKIEISDYKGESTFRLSPIDGTYPDYGQITGAWSGEGQMVGDWKPTGFDPKYLKTIGDIANRLGAKGVECFAPIVDKKGPNPALFTFSGIGGVALFLMPRVVDAAVAEETRQLLAPAIKLTLAALKAHETRQRKAAKKATGAEKEAATAKADEFKARIEALVARVGTGEVVAALPAPQAPVEQPEVEDQDEQPVAIGDTLEADAPQDEEAPEVEAAPVDEPAASEPVVQKPNRRNRKGGKKSKR